jgi:hypothetical protein
MLNLRNGMRALLLPSLIIICSLITPELKAQVPYKKKITNWINWNFLFKTGSDSLQRQNVINDVMYQIAGFSKQTVVDMPRKYGKITSSLKKYTGKYKNNFVITRISSHYCNNGDTLFVNLRADAELSVAASDSIPSQPTTTPPKPVVKPAGGLIEQMGLNNLINLPHDSLMLVQTLKRVSFIQPIHFNDRAVIAILDSGIDTTMFEEGFRTELLWNGAGGSKNMVVGQDINNYMDNFSVKHGTSVATIALTSYNKSGDTSELPKLMVVKVLNDEGAGSVFELCCGLKYASDNHATVINASLGYASNGGDNNEDKVLQFYLQQCQLDSIPVIAAAGNSEEHRDPDLICAVNATNVNEITDRNQTLPAGYAVDENKYSVISVTGFRKPGMPCYYQKYSGQFISIGVLNTATEANCCSFKLPFFNQLVEGSSYATPVVAGKLAFSLTRLGHSSIANYMRRMNVKNDADPAVSPVVDVTMHNQYITY